MKARRLLYGLLLACTPLFAFGKTFLIDVRTPQEYAEGHLSGAINIDHSVIAQQISKAGVGKDDEVILYCRSGRRSGIALETLQGMGYRQAKNYGSMDEARQKLTRKP